MSLPEKRDDYFCLLTRVIDSISHQVKEGAGLLVVLLQD